MYIYCLIWPTGTELLERRGLYDDGNVMDVMLAIEIEETRQLESCGHKGRRSKAIPTVCVYTLTYITNCCFHSVIWACVCVHVHGTV